MLAVNKIDLVDYSQSVFEKIVADFSAFAAKLNFQSQVAIPLSARYGVNVMAKSPETPWYKGPALLEHLEKVDVDTVLAARPAACRCRVNRPNLDFRGFRTVVGGRVRPGDNIAVAKSGRVSKIARIVTMDGDLPGAVAGDAVTLTLTDEVDISRRCLAATDSRPDVSDQFAAHLLWMAEDEMLPGRQYSACWARPWCRLRSLSSNIRWMSIRWIIWQARRSRSMKWATPISRFLSR